jgi:putative DNA primase/helicase
VNGKTTLFETLRAILGEDLAIAAPRNLLLLEKSDRHPDEIMRLFGKRLVMVSEVPEASVFQEEKVKSLTGDDRLSGRGMRENWTDFAPTHKLVLYANRLPRVRDRSEGFWRRVHVVPFDAHFPEGQRDPRLREKLLAERDGILRWCVEGCLRWQREGLERPQTVSQATSAYANEQDVVGRWLADFLAEHSDQAGQWVKSSWLHEQHKRWAEDEGEKALSGKALAKELSERGWQRRRSKHGAEWQVPTQRTQGRGV